MARRLLKVGFVEDPVVDWDIELKPMIKDFGLDFPDVFEACVLTFKPNPSPNPALDLLNPFPNPIPIFPTQNLALTQPKAGPRAHLCYREGAVPLRHPQPLRDRPQPG